MLTYAHVPYHPHHETALDGFRRLERDRLPAATSTHILDETITLPRRWAGHRFAAERARAILASRAIRVLRSSESAEVAALVEFERLAEYQVSYTDAISFALMCMQKIREAFAFDRHFLLAGFALWPPPAS